MSSATFQRGLSLREAVSLDVSFKTRPRLRHAATFPGRRMNLSRRGLIGSLLAAPAIIRTPGLLMPISAPRFEFKTFEIGYMIAAANVLQRA